VKGFLNSNYLRYSRPENLNTNKWLKNSGYRIYIRERKRERDNIYSMMKIYKQEGFFVTLFASMSIILMTSILSIKTELFVRDIEDLIHIGPAIGFMFAIGLILKWRFIRLIVLTVLAAFTAFHLFFLLSEIFFDQNITMLQIISWIVLILLEIIVLAILVISKSLKVYMKIPFDEEQHNI
jgi:hypothetical protein